MVDDIEQLFHEGALDMRLKNRFHFAVPLYSDNGQMTSKRGENKEMRYATTRRLMSNVTDVVTTF